MLTKTKQFSNTYKKKKKNNKNKTNLKESKHFEAENPMGEKKGRKERWREGGKVGKL